MAEWITEARCWVLRNRAQLLELALGVGSVSSRVTVQPGFWLGWVAGAGSHQTSGVGCLVGVLFPRGMFFYLVVVMDGSVFLPVF